MQLRFKPLHASSFTKKILNLTKMNEFLLNSTHLVFSKKIDIDPFRNYIVIYANEPEFFSFLDWLEQYTNNVEVNYSKITSNLILLGTTKTTKLFYFSYIIEIENLSMDLLLSYLYNKTNIKLIGFISNSIYYWAGEFVTFNDKSIYVDCYLFSSFFININSKKTFHFDSNIF